MAISPCSATMATPSWSSTARFTTTPSCGASSKRWGIVSIRTAIPRRCCTRSSNGMCDRSRSCAACSPRRSGTSRAAGWCWCATAWASNRCISPARRRFYFGSEMKAILLHPEIEPPHQPAALDRYLSCNYVPGTADAGGRDRKTASRELARMAGRPASIQPYWTLEFKPDSQLDLADGERGAGPAAAFRRARTFDIGRAARRVVQRRPRFLHHPALRRRIRSAR